MTSPIITQFRNRKGISPYIQEPLVILNEWVRELRSIHEVSENPSSISNIGNQEERKSDFNTLLNMAKITMVEKTSIIQMPGSIVKPSNETL